MPASTSTQILDPAPGKNAAVLLALAALCTVAYLPALNNGFISDDYVILERVTVWKADFSFVLKMSPERFRLTSYLAFGLLKALFGYHAAGFYLFAILIHFLNAALLWRFLGRVSGSPGLAVLASMLFAAYQGPQEAVMWLAGMNEALMTLFVLLALLFWTRGSYVLSSIACLAALFSKESWIVVLPLLPLVDGARGSKAFDWRRYLTPALPLLVFAILFINSLSANALVGEGYYALGPRALLVGLNSLHRLAFPWLYLALLLRFALRRDLSFRPAVPGIVWMAVALLPYVFLTYQNHVPSRNIYLASAGLAWSLAVLTEEVPGARLRAALIAAFIVGNVAYLWLVKDRQYVQRAAPTTLLLEKLRSHPPGPVCVEGFPLNPWIARMTTRLAPGWAPEMLRVNEKSTTSSGCREWRWDSKSETYILGEGLKMN